MDMLDSPIGGDYMDAGETVNSKKLPLPPQVEISDSVFNFHDGDLGKVKRIVQRQQLKTRIKFLQQVIKVHQPLVKAMQITQKAFQDGVKEGLLQAIKAEKEAEDRKAQATSLEGQGQPLARESGEAVPLTSGVSGYKNLPSASPELHAALNP